MLLCVGPGEVSNLDCERRHCSLYHLLVSLRFLRETNVGIFSEGNLLLSTSNLPLGVTSEEHYFSAIKRISGAVAGDSRSYKRLAPSTTKFLALYPGTPVYKIGELHTIFYLCFLVLLVYLSAFTFVSLIKNTKNTCCYHGFQ